MAAASATAGPIQRYASPDRFASHLQRASALPPAIHGRTRPAGRAERRNGSGRRRQIGGGYAACAGPGRGRAAAEDLARDVENASGTPLDVVGAGSGRAARPRRRAPRRSRRSLRAIEFLPSNVFDRCTGSAWMERGGEGLETVALETDARSVAEASSDSVAAAADGVAAAAAREIEFVRRRPRARRACE